MTEREAVEIMSSDVPSANIQEHIDAIKVAKYVLGDNYSEGQLKNWILVNKYPFLMPKKWNRETMQYEVYKDYDYKWTELDAMPDGWRNTFGEMMCEEIMNALVECDSVDDYIIEEIKEKFGQLRWYAYPSYKSVHRIIEKYSYLSENICWKCGKPDVPMTGYNYILPMCEDCYCTPNEYYKQDKTPDELLAFQQTHKREWEKFNSERENRMENEYTVITWSKEKGETKTTYDISETVAKIRKRYYG